MIVDLSDILDKPKDYVFILDKEWWQPNKYDEQILGLNSALDVNITISKAGRRFVLRGHLKGTLLLQCDRCLGQFTRALDCDFDLFLDRLPETWDEDEVELIEEDMGVDFVQGDEIDLAEIVREQIYLSIPMKSLCSESCLGLCPRCGTNLNKGKCLCSQNTCHPAFEKLRNLKIKENN